jgi:predicted nucleotidyltransferase
MPERHTSPLEVIEYELRNDILKTVAYFDLFEYPLTADQIFSFLPRNSVTAEHVERSVHHLVAERRLAGGNGYYFLPSVDPSITEKRRVMEEYAQKMLKTARLVSRFIKRFPYIRGIFITGSLSKNVADPSSDIDFMIITAPGRLWISRMLLTMFRKVFLFGNSKFFCTNYYISEHNLSLDRRNLYTAVEVVTTKVIWNEDAFRMYQSSNSWTTNFLPNISIPTDEQLLIPRSRSIVQRTVEFVLELFPVQRFDTYLMEYHRSHWWNMYGNVGEERFRSMFIISKDISASWPEDRQVPVLTRFREKTAQLGLR